MATLTTIWWRDIPAQVTARDGRRSSKIVLHPRFQVAIDKAASRAGKRAYIELETSLREIVDVTSVTSQRASPSALTCLREAVWAEELPEAFDFESDSFVIAI